MLVDPRFLDPSGWEPTDIQMSVPPETKGLLWEDWLRKWHGLRPLRKPVKREISMRVEQADGTHDL